jgi:hypothetical protein
MLVNRKVSELLILPGISQVGLLFEPCACPVLYKNLEFYLQKVRHDNGKSHMGRGDMPELQFKVMEVCVFWKQ